MSEREAIEYIRSRMGDLDNESVRWLKGSLATLLAELDRLKAILASGSKATANYGATGTATLAEVKSDVE